MATAHWIWDLILELQPGRKPPNFEAWANSIRLLRERDGRTDREIRDLYGWVNRDEFWRLNILSPDKLREKWDDLDLKRKRGTTNGPKLFRMDKSSIARIHDDQERGGGQYSFGG